MPHCRYATAREVILISQRKRKQVQIERKLVLSASMLEKLAAMNAMKTE